MQSRPGMSPENTCRRCGQCCQQGGAALHSADRDLVVTGHLQLTDLITVRAGELAIQPLADSPVRVEKEFLKLQSQGSSWCCRFYDFQEKGCSIYQYRPLACRLLDCSHPDELLSIAGRDLLTRFDLIPADDPLTKLVNRHLKICPYPDLNRYYFSGIKNLNRDEIAELNQLINHDLGLRMEAGDRFGLSLDQELFYFGRPMFQIFQQLGFTVLERNNRLVLHSDQ